jgi:hypothetical protein
MGDEQKATAGDSKRLTASNYSSSTETRGKKDIESGRILGPVVSPVAGAVKAVTETFLPKIQKVPWIHFFILSFLIAIP